jgi:hypothetical protein
MYGINDPWENSRSYRPWLAAGSVRNGDNIFVYPMRNAEAKEPYLVDSIRWELEREGAEDFEYLWLLSDLVGRASKIEGLEGAAREARAVLQEAEGLVRRPAKSREFPEYRLDFEQDPRAYYEARERVGGQIERLGAILGE